MINLQIYSWSNLVNCPIRHNSYVINLSGRRLRPIALSTRYIEVITVVVPVTYYAIVRISKRLLKRTNVVFIFTTNKAFAGKL